MGTFFVYPFSGSTSPNYLVTSDFLYSTVYSILSGYTVMSVFGRIGNVSGQTGDYDISQISGLVSAINAKQNIIATGSTSQYIKGDGSLGIFPTSNTGFTNDAQYITSLTGYSNPSWITSLPYFKLTGTPFIYSFSGLTSQYTKGDGSYATFPTNVSSFANDAGYLTVAGSGTITGITLNTPNVIYSTPTIFSVSGGTAFGTLSLISQSGNTVFAAPATGGTPTFRKLISSDIPDLSATYGSLNSANTWNGGQIITSTGVTQLSLIYDATHGVNFNVSGSGTLTISGNNASNLVLTSFATLNATNITTTGLLDVNNGNTTSNLYVWASKTATTSSTSQLLITTATTINFRRSMRGSSTPAADVNTDYSGTIFGQETVSMATGGTHTVFTTASFISPLITTNTGSTLAEATTVYIKDAPTTGLKNYALHAGGATQIDGNLGLLSTGATQFTIAYDPTHTSTFAVDSGGQLTITPTSGQFATMGGKVQMASGYQTGSAGTSSNVFVPSGNTTASSTIAQLLPTTGTTVNFRRASRGSVSSTPAAGTDYIGTIFGQEDATMASSGIHTMFANTLFYAPTITTNTGSTLLEAANVYIKNAPTGGVANFALHVGGASQFDAPINITNTNAQLFLTYDATHIINFTVLSNGNLTISGNSASALSLTSFSTVSTTNFTVNGTIATNSTVNNSNFYVTGGNNITAGGLSQSTASLLFAGASTVAFRVLMRGSSASTLGAGDSYSALLIGQHAITAASSGTHGLLASLVVRAGTVTTNTGSTITNTSSFYIDGAGTVGVNNYAMWVGSGISKFDGGIQKPINATAKTTTYNITTADHTIRADSTASGYTITLPTAVGIQGQIFVVRVSAGTNTVTVATTSSQNINGTSSATTYTGLTTKGKYVWVQSNNVDWDIITSN